MAKKTVTKREVEVSINPYELMLILNPELRESEIKKKLKEITGMIEKGGGKITNEDFWDKKNLAYRVKKHWEGIYMVYNIELPNNFLNELRNYLRIEKEVLRSMFLKLPADYTYTKYDLEAVAEEEKKEKRSFKKNVSIKHNAPIIAPKPAPAKTEESKTEEKKEDTKEEKVVKKEIKDVDEAELDKKLDEIIGGEDLNL